MRLRIVIEIAVPDSVQVDGALLVSAAIAKALDAAGSLPGWVVPEIVEVKVQP